MEGEFATLRLLDHPNIVKVFEVYEDRGHWYLVTEFCQGGELFQQLKSKGTYSEYDAASIIE